MTEVKCSCRVLESRGGEVGLPGEGVKVTWARRGLLSSRAALFLLAFCLHCGPVSGLAVGIPLGLPEFSFGLSAIRSWRPAGMVSEGL